MHRAPQPGWQQGCAAGLPGCTSSGLHHALIRLSGDAAALHVAVVESNQPFWAAISRSFSKTHSKRVLVLAGGCHCSACSRSGKQSASGS
eukprot:scaffold25548_cov16-Tisochrysis_lutea.AAC.1